MTTLCIWVAGSRAEQQEISSLPTLGEIRDGILARELAIENLSFRLTYHDRSRINLEQGAPFSSTTQVLDVILDMSHGDSYDLPRARIELVESSPDSGQPPLRQVAVLGPSGLQVLEPAQKGNPPMALIDTERGFRWKEHPSFLLALNRFSPSLYLDREPARIVGWKHMAGHDTIQVESGGEKPLDQRAEHVYLWISPKLGHAIVRSELHGRYPGMAMRLIRLLESRDFVEVDGIWLPRRIQFTHFSYKKDGSYEKNRELVADFENWKVNQSISESLFNLELPSGTRVADNSKGRLRYVKDAVNDQLVEQQTRAARELVGAAQSLESRHGTAVKENPFRNYPAWITTSLIVALIVGVVVVLTWRNRRAG